MSAVDRSVLVRQATDAHITSTCALPPVTKPGKVRLATLEKRASTGQLVSGPVSFERAPLPTHDQLTDAPFVPCGHIFSTVKVAREQLPEAILADLKAREAAALLKAQTDGDAGAATSTESLAKGLSQVRITHPPSHEVVQSIEALRDNLLKTFTSNRAFLTKHQTDLSLLDAGLSDDDTELPGKLAKLTKKFTPELFAVLAWANDPLYAFFLQTFVVSDKFKPFAKLYAQKALAPHIAQLTLSIKALSEQWLEELVKTRSEQAEEKTSHGADGKKPSRTGWRRFRSLSTV